MQKLLHVNTFGTFVVDACIADAVNSQYPDDGPFAPRVKEERGCIINISSVVAKPVPARCLTYGTSKCVYAFLALIPSSITDPDQRVSSGSLRDCVTSWAHSGSESVPCLPQWWLRS